MGDTKDLTEPVAPKEEQDGKVSVNKDINIKIRPYGTKDNQLTAESIEGLGSLQFGVLRPANTFGIDLRLYQKLGDK